MSAVVERVSECRLRARVGKIERKRQSERESNTTFPSSVRPLSDDLSYQLMPKSGARKRSLECTPRLPLP